MQNAGVMCLVLFATTLFVVCCTCYILHNFYRSFYFIVTKVAIHASIANAYLYKLHLAFRNNNNNNNNNDRLTAFDPGQPG